ncbi:MAG TPA: antibiotic biosynthesis monooxygenase [Candidatus Acidoferrum sp.]|nr:antibiotic biosynthesis monooxygenase [Candidatus Acidoferrum sp.]
MIARLWSARASNLQSTHYLEHFWQHVLPTLKKHDGYVSASVLVRPHQDSVEILVMSIWQSSQAIDAFAGPDREIAVVDKAAAELLTDYDRRVRHFELAQMDGVTFRQPS